MIEPGEIYIADFAEAGPHPVIVVSREDLNRGSQEPEDDDLEPEYDFSGALRGKYYQRYQEGTNVVLLDADVAAGASQTQLF